MKAIHIASLGIIPAALLITACGDDVTKVTKIEGTSGMEVVASADSLGKCTEEISGEMKFATKENAVYVCADSAWKNVSKTEKTTCSAETLADSSGFKIVCDGDSVGVIRDGIDGKDGEKGKSGDACDISDNGDGTVSVVCGDASTILYKAFCGGKVYDPDSNFCFADSLVPLCGGESYDLDESFCVADSIVPLCGGKSYNLDSSFCLDDVVIENSKLLGKKLVWDLMNSEIEYDMFIDKRDSQVYRSVKIGEQTWMAENLNYETDSSYCYKDNPENCQKYGRLYATRDIAKSACPAGWHLPDTSEILSLIAAAEGIALPRGENYMAGKALKSKSGWNWNTDDDKDGNGTDSLGFSALPAGYKEYNSNFTNIGGRANFWSSSGKEGVDFYLSIFSDGDDGSLYIYYHSSTVVGNSYSVRCVRD